MTRWRRHWGPPRDPGDPGEQISATSHLAGGAFICRAPWCGCPPNGAAPCDETQARGHLGLPSRRRRSPSSSPSEGLPSSAAAATTYLTATAAVADVTDDVAATGAIASSTTWSPRLRGGRRARPDRPAGSPATWLVGEVKVKVGDRVKKGDVLATASNADAERPTTPPHNAVTTAHDPAGDGEGRPRRGDDDREIRRTRIDCSTPRTRCARPRPDSPT